MQVSFLSTSELFGDDNMSEIVFYIMWHDLLWNSVTQNDLYLIQCCYNLHVFVFKCMFMCQYNTDMMCMWPYVKKQRLKKGKNHLSL